MFPQKVSISLNSSLSKCSPVAEHKTQNFTSAANNLDVDSQSDKIQIVKEVDDPSMKDGCEKHRSAGVVKRKLTFGGSILIFLC